MMARLRLQHVAWAGGLAAAVAATPASAVVRDEPTINGVAVYRYTWTDSQGLKRSVSFKKQGAGNPGNGGYIVRTTFQYVSGGVTRTVTANSPSANEGFGYFVSHERYRKFSDGDSQPIAGKIFGKDDSPLGRGFPVTTLVISTASTKGAIRFKLDYPRYGTVNAAGYNANTGEDSPPLGLNAAQYKLYTLPVTMHWYVQDGTDYPRVVTRVELTDVPGPDRVSFDLRGPYGKLDFDAGDNPIRWVYWGDRFRFAPTAAPLTRNTTWTYNSFNTGARYHTLVAGSNEMGLVEPTRFASSRTNDGYSESRGKTSRTYHDGQGCTEPGNLQLLPCNWEWPYQSAQNELPQNDRTAPTTSEKIAWGSTSLYGMSLPATYDGLKSVPFEGYPESKLLLYQVCLVFGRTQAGGLARAVADAGGSYNCAEAKTQ